MSLLNKAILFIKSIPSGARWITVHPHKDGKGQPLLIQEERNGTARVIGGAGGKLNYLKLKGVKSEAEYKKQSADKAKAKTAEKKAQRKRDKDLGVYEAKKQAKENVSSQRIAHEKEYIKTVSSAMGWDDKETEFPEELYENVSENARTKAKEKHHRQLLSKANEAVEVQRRQLVVDADARTQADIGEIPLDSDDSNVLSVDDIDPIHIPAGLGYTANYSKRAEQKGLTKDQLSDELRSLRKDGESKANSSTNKARQIADELKNIRDESVSGIHAGIADPAEAVKLIKAQKALKEIQKKARQANTDIDSSIEPKAYVLSVSNNEINIDSDLENDLRTLKTRAFLSEVGKIDDYEKSLGKHLGVGSYNAINSFSLTATGSALIDRDVVDVLGVAGASQVVIRRLTKDMTDDEMSNIKQALEQFHKDHYIPMTDSALKRTQELHDVAKEIEINSAMDGADLSQMMTLNEQRKNAIAEAQKIIGQTLGEMETNAALIMALGQGRKDQVEVSMGKTSNEQAIKQARAIGLERGDYVIAKAGVNRFLTISADGMDRLASPVNRGDIEHQRKTMDIIEGRNDEDNWLPGGIANRPDLSLSLMPGVAEKLSKPFNADGNVEQSIKDYIGGRTADGDKPVDIISDLMSQDMPQHTVGRDSYIAALNKIAPLKADDGSMIRAENHEKAFQSMADDFVQAQYGSKRQPIHQQTFETDHFAVDALHRALSQEPMGIAAYKPIGELDKKECHQLRKYFAKHIGKQDENVNQLRENLALHLGKQPEKEIEDMFGTGTNPEYTDWKSKRDSLSEDINSAELNWQKYSKMMGGPEKAYAAIQDVVRSSVSKSFQETYNTLNPSSPLKLGRTVIRGNLNHLDAVDRDARDKRVTEQRELVDSLRDRVQGRYASGAVSDKMDAARENIEAMSQSQMGFFSTHESEPEKEVPLARDERNTLGHAAELKIASMMPIVGKNFKADQPTQLWQASMNGKYINQQRAVKLIEHNKRLVLAQGVGSGKSLIGLAGFSHLHEQGKAHRGLFIVPSIVQGQFNGEALRYLDPGKFKWHAQPGASREERIQGYKDPENHFSVVTHAGFRDDMLYLGAKQSGIEKEEMSNRVNSMTDPERKAWAKSVMTAEGIDYDYLMVDEGHDLLNRAGKQNSRMANVIDGVSANASYYVSASADPVKNDASEVHDLLRKMDPEKYSDRDKFMRRYGVDTVSSKEGLRREMSRYFYPGRIESGKKAHKITKTLPLSSAQKESLGRIDRAVAQSRIEKIRGNVDVDSMKILSPASFENSDVGQHKEIAAKLQDNVGIMHSTAVRRILDSHAENPKMDYVDKFAEERRGKPGVIFAHSLDSVSQIEKRLRKNGHKVVTLTGNDSSSDKEKKKQAFKPEHDGEAEADIIIASDAGATGANLQRGQWLVQYDTPMTAKTHAQRRGRIDRLGQKNDVELVDLVSDHATERKNRRRLTNKYQLREVLTSPLEGLDDTGFAGYLQKSKLKKEGNDGTAH